METGSAMVEIQQNTGDFNALLKSQQTIAKGEEVSITYGCLVVLCKLTYTVGFCCFAAQHVQHVTTSVANVGKSHNRPRNCFVDMLGHDSWTCWLCLKMYIEGFQVLWPNWQFFTGLFSNTHLLLKYGFVSPWLHNSTCLTKIKLEFQAVDHFRIFRDPNDPNPLGKAIGKNIVFTLDACPGEGMRITDGINVGFESMLQHLSNCWPHWWMVLFAIFLGFEFSIWPPVSVAVLCFH